MLAEVPHGERAGWVFEPASLQPSRGRKPAAEYRPNAEWVAKIVSRIGKAAGVIVEPVNETGRPAKFASSHDLRRSCAERLVEAGIPEGVITRVLRHASWETTRRHYAPGNVQRDATVLRDLLSSERKTENDRESAHGSTRAAEQSTNSVAVFLPD